MRLIKKKVTIKHIPPDIPAAKILLEMLNIQTTDIAAMTDEQLQNEKKRLIEIILKAENVVVSNEQTINTEDNE